MFYYLNSVFNKFLSLSYIRTCSWGTRGSCLLSLYCFMALTSQIFAPHAEFTVAAFHSVYKVCKQSEELQLLVGDVTVRPSTCYFFYLTLDVKEGHNTNRHLSL